MVTATLAGKMPTTTLTAQQLIAEAQAFSPTAWAHLFDQYHAKMYDYCYLRTGDRAAAEDLASDVFLEAVRGIRRYRYRGVPISAWLYGIARNLTADFVRRRASRPTLPLPEAGTHAALTTPDGAEASDRAHDLRGAIRHLTDDQQQVIILRFFHGLSHDETAAVLGRSSGAVRVLQSRALSALRRVMTGQPRGQAS
jgi:RNA polymerase sigma-70 factor (ECF subfamily)